MQDLIQRRSFILGLLAAPAAPVVLRSLAFGQISAPNGGTAESQQVLEMAKSVFLTDTESVTHQRGGDSAWFNAALNPISEANPDLAVVARNVALTSPFDMSRHAVPGDIVRLEWDNDGRPGVLVLVYTGEETFPDSKERKSFFIFPYRHGLEYNTIPPRRHEKGMSVFRFDDIAPLDPSVESLFLTYTEPDASRGGRRWATFDDAYDLNSSLTNGSARATVYRARRVPSGDTQFAFQIRQGEYAGGSSLQGSVGANGPVGIESDLLQKSWEVPGQGSRTVADLGRVDKPGLYFIRARYGNAQALQFLAVVPGDAGMFSVYSKSLPPELQESLVEDSLDSRFFGLLRAGDWQYLKIGMKAALPAFHAANHLAPVVLILSATTGIAGVISAAADAGSLAFDFVVAAFAKAADAMAKDMKISTAEAQAVAAKWKRRAAYASLLCSAASLTSVRKWKSLNDVNKWEAFLDATEAVNTVTQEFIVADANQTGEVVTTVISNQAKTVLHIIGHVK